MTQFARGAIASPKHRVFGATPHVATTTPPSWGVVPTKLQVWGNEVDGDCVSAEEAAAKLMYSVMRGGTELRIPDSVLVAWAGKHGWLNGAVLTDVMDTMETEGITVNGVTYKDGPAKSVNWMDDATLSSAIYTGPVKIGVAADQLQAVASGGKNGWIAAGFKHDGNVDHCVNLCGFGTAQECADMLGTSLSVGVDPTARAYLLFTWGTIGIIGQKSLYAITSEAWLRGPTTLPDPAPAPAPVPMPPPGPPPTSSGVIIIDMESRAISAAGYTLIPSP